MPDWSFEQHAAHPVCGVDEAGRGPLAGPVVAAAVILDPSDFPSGLEDSKRLIEQHRIFLFKELKKTALIGFGIAEPEEIDRLNILQATLRAMKRAVDSLPVSPQTALIDGNKAPPLPCYTQTIVQGDSKSLSIAAASIAAKTLRDKLMIEADRRFPSYGFAQHKGYPTQLHRDRLENLGPSPLHRMSFRPCQIAKEVYKQKEKRQNL